MFVQQIFLKFHSFCHTLLAINWWVLMEYMEVKFVLTVSCWTIYAPCDLAQIDFHFSNNTAATWKTLHLFFVCSTPLWWCLRRGGHLPTYIPGLAVQLGCRWEICVRKKQSTSAADTTPWHRQGWLVLPLCKLPRVCPHHHHILPQHFPVSHLPGKSPLLWEQAGSQPRCSPSVWYMLLLGKITFQKFT